MKFFFTAVLIVGQMIRHYFDAAVTQGDQQHKYDQKLHRFFFLAGSYFMILQ
jgi:hypothetical protein